MKQVFTYLTALLIGFSAFAQSDKATDSYKPSYQDSIRLILENTKAIDASAIGAAFATGWSSFSPDNQTAIQQHLKRMKKKGHRLRPQVVNYLGAIMAGINVEKLDPSRLTSFLTVAGMVIEKENPGQANIFFQQSRDFFEHHALWFEKAFRLHVKDDSYDFDYIEAAKPDTTASSAPPDTTSSTLPAWRQPIVQPDLFGAIIEFSKLTLNFVTPYDSVLLKDTKGSYSLRDKTFVGEGGKFDWSNAGLGSDSVFCDLNKYHFKANQPYLKAEQSNLTYVGRLAGRIPGVFEYKSVNHKKNASYPRFKSYENNVALLGLPADVKYEGGFGLIGASMNSLSVGNAPSTIKVSRQSDRKFRAESLSFAFKDSTVIGTSAKITIFQENDSLYHPAMNLHYDYGKEILILSKDKSPLRSAPVSASYFGIDFNADDIRWNLKSDSLSVSLDGTSNVAPMILESVDFYDPEDYRKLKGEGFSFHALALVVNYAKKINSQDFYVFDLAGAKKSLNEVKMAADFLSQKGMINYDARTGKIHVKDKAMHFVSSVKGDADYDNLKIHSLMESANASINLKKGTMTVKGVEEFNLSDSLNVIIKPDSSLITFMHNRDIKFDGMINAGNFEIKGKEFMLKYDSFYINLRRVDSIRFYVTEKNGVRRRVNNSMVGTDSSAVAGAGLLASSTKTSGTLFINRPDNKSGRKVVPHYPRFDASAGGMIYFDRKEVLDGAYDKSVFFVVPPFKIDSLNDADPGSINFEGTFISSGMFPTFKEKLHTMSDRSLGFTHGIPADGYNLYKGEGKIYGGLSLDNDGIRSNGKIKYLPATIESKDFVFYPDSVTAKSAIGEVKEEQYGSVLFPQITIPESQIKWQPKQDKFRIKNTRDPFAFYNNTASLNGSITLSKKGVSGIGKLSTRGSEVVSRDLSFTGKEFKARHARFRVTTGNPDKPALAGTDVSLRFNLDENYATIRPEVAGVAAIEFPYAQFKTSIPEARWDLNTQKIAMTKAADVPLEDSYFYTTRKELDSLSFNAEKAEYDIKTQQLKVSGIPFIVVADAKITPENNEVLILENSRIDQLKNTTIVFDTLNGYHRLTNGVVDIISRKEFKGYATYQYVNAANDTFAIKMTDFHLEPIVEEAKTKRKDKRLKATMQTVTDGKVEPADKLALAPRIYYKGDMIMYATKPALQLAGYVKMDLKKIKNYDTWIRFEQNGDEKDIFIDFDNAVTEGGRKAQAGLHYGSDNSLYITFVFDKKDDNDDDFFLPSGSLFFDKESGEFKIEDREKAAGNKLSGKVFNYNEEKQEVHFEGPVNFFKGSNDFNLTSTVIGSGNLETNDIKMNSLIMANMNIPLQAYQLMAMNIQDVIKNEGANEGLGDQTELLYKIANIVGERVAKDYEQKSLQNYVSLGTIQGLAQPIVFSNVNLKWSQDKKAFYSEGTLGVSNIGRNDINGAFEGFMELRRTEDGTPVFHVFFKASPEAWYYFGFEDNRLMIQSSNPAFNDLISKKSNASKAKVGELVFVPGSDDETLAFINRFRLNYYGLEAPYDLSGGTAAAKKKDDKKKTEKKEDDGF